MILLLVPWIPVSVILACKVCRGCSWRSPLFPTRTVPHRSDPFSPPAAHLPSRLTIAVHSAGQHEKKGGARGAQTIQGGQGQGRAQTQAGCQAAARSQARCAHARKAVEQTTPLKDVACRMDGGRERGVARGSGPPPRTAFSRFFFSFHRLSPHF